MSLSRSELEWIRYLRTNAISDQDIEWLVRDLTLENDDKRAEVIRTAKITKEPYQTLTNPYPRTYEKHKAKEAWLVANPEPKKVTTRCGTFFGGGPADDGPPIGWEPKYNTKYNYSYTFNGREARYTMNEDDSDYDPDGGAQQYWHKEKDARLSLGAAIAEYLLENA